MRLLVVLLVLVAASARTSAAPHVERTCLTKEPTMAQREAQMRRLESAFGLLSPEARLALDEFLPMVIPVVFHVIHVDGVRGNVSEDIIKQQIQVLNRGFGGRTSRRSVDTKISFVLRSINYIQNPEWFEYCLENEDKIREALAIDPLHVINAYTCSGSGYLGWSRFPGMEPEASPHNFMMLNVDALPGGSLENFSEGDTAVHELGHFFGLFHTFSSESCLEFLGDSVADTPLQKSSTSGCPVGRDSCPNHSGLDPIDNFMDYSYDPCMSRFTAGQARRMRESIAVQRPILFNNTKQQQTTAIPDGPSTRSERTCGQIGWVGSKRVPGVCISAKIRNGCSSGVTSATAERSCKSVGARLCTANELFHGVVADAKSCPLPPMWTLSGTSCGGTSRYAVQDSTGRVACQPNSFRGARLCCADFDVKRKKCSELQWPVLGGGICSSSVIGGKCTRLSVFSDAAKTCRAIGARLCTKSEMMSGFATPSAPNQCDFQAETLFWTSTRCARAAVWATGPAGNKQGECVTTEAITRDWATHCCSDATL